MVQVDLFVFGIALDSFQCYDIIRFNHSKEKNGSSIKKKRKYQKLIYCQKYKEENQEK